MEHRVSYTVIGAFVIILGGMLVAALLWLSSGGLGRDYTTYVVYLKSGAASLGPDSTVLYNGVPVGQVSSISLDPQDPRQARVLLNIREGTPVKTDTVAEIETRGVTGSGYVNLIGGSPAAPLLTAQAGQPYPVIPARQGGLESLTGAAQKVAQKLLDISGRLERVLSEKNIDALSASLANIQAATTNLVAESRELNTELASVHGILANAGTATAKLPELMDEIRNTVASFHELARRATDAASGVGDTAARLRQLTPQAQVLLTRLNQATESLDTLLETLNRQPSAVIFGTTAKPGPGESGGGG